MTSADAFDSSNVGPPSHATRCASRTERLLVLVVLYFVSTARLPFVSSPADPDPGTALLIFRYAILLIVTLLLLFFYRAVARGLSTNSAILALTGLALLSTLWSQTPAFTWREATYLLAITLFALYVAGRFSVEDYLHTLALLGATIAVLSLLLVAIPGTGAIDDSGNWRGVFVHKNLLGEHMAMAVLVWTVTLRLGGRYRIAAFVMLPLCVMLGLHAGSATAVAMTAGALFSLPLIRLAASGSGMAGVFLVVVGILTPVVSLRIDSTYIALVQSLGRDTSMTGRTELWGAIIDRIRDRPWTGYGYDAFWLGRDGASAKLERLLGWAPAHAHNGYLDVLLVLGVPGLLLVAVAFLVAMVNALRFLKTHPDVLHLFPCLSIGFILVYNMVESSLLVQPGTMWVMFVSLSGQVALYSAARHPASARPSPAPPPLSLHTVHGD